jgi:hypothetical protein
MTVLSAVVSNERSNTGAGNMGISHVVQWGEVICRAGEPHMGESQFRTASTCFPEVGAMEASPQGDNVMGEAPYNLSKRRGHVNHPEMGEEPGLLNPDAKPVMDASVPVEQEVKGVGAVQGCGGASTGYKARGGGYRATD